MMRDAKVERIRARRRAAAVRRAAPDGPPMPVLARREPTYRAALGAVDAAERAALAELAALERFEDDGRIGRWEEA